MDLRDYSPLFWNRKNSCWKAHESWADRMPSGGTRSALKDGAPSDLKIAALVEIYKWAHSEPKCYCGAHNYGDGGRLVAEAVLQKLEPTGHRAP